MLTIIIYPDSCSPNSAEPLDQSLINQMYELIDIALSPILPREENAAEGYRMWREGYEKNVAAGTKYILLLRDGTLSGYLVFTCNYGGRDEIFINDIIIHPRRQADGVTLRNLVYCFIKEIAAQTNTIISAYANKVNHRSQDLMKKAGFQVERHTERGIRFIMLRRQFIERFDSLFEKGSRAI